MNDNAPKTNKEHVSETERELKRKRIVSPDINSMPFHIHDKTSRTWYFYLPENEEHYRHMVKKFAGLYPDHVFQLSHPDVL